MNVIGGVIVHVLSTIVINPFLYSGCHDILNTDEQLDLRYILYFKTFAPQCEVKIIVSNIASFYSIIVTKYLFSINDFYTCSWFSWTFTNIKQVVEKRN
jgi:hypothetical protein